MTTEPCLVSGGPIGKPRRDLTLEPGPIGAEGLDAFVTGLCGMLGFAPGHLEYGASITFSPSGAPAPAGYVAGQLAVHGAFGSYVAELVTIETALLSRFGVPVPAEPAAPAPAALSPDDRLTRLEARVEALERKATR